MTMKFFLVLAACLLQINWALSGHATYTAAKCEMGDKGVIQFREGVDGLEARVHLHKLDESNAHYSIHVHENAYGGSCVGVGGHFNPDVTDEDEGVLKGVSGGGFQSNDKAQIHTIYFPVPDLSLSGPSTGIVGKSMAVHNSEGKEICCGIESAQYNDSPHH